MVKVRQEQPIRQDGTIDIDTWLDDLQHVVEFDDRDELYRACDMAMQAQDSVKDSEDGWDDANYNSFHAGLEMVHILAELQQGQAALVAAALYRSVREEKLPIELVCKEFGEEVARMIMGVLQMAAIGSRKNPRIKDNVLGGESTQMDNLRKMLVAIIDDVRVALIKIAERTCAIRRVKKVSRRKRYLVSREVFDIYAPLAHRLGIGQLKWELEDLSFRYLKPNDYKSIAELLDEKRLDRQQYINQVVERLRTEIEHIGIQGEVTGRAKHIYSIWRKMQLKNIDFSQVYDVRAVRILVPESRDCYAVLGIVHGLWRNIPHEFDDYIASPKPNGYRSLHTAVFGPDGKVLEVQIRTFDMHEEAELGVCAHYLYKGTDVRSGSDAYEEKIAWLRQVLEWHDALGENEGLGEMLRGDVVQDRLYIFTPDGHVIDMPKGSTPIDFAYRVHTEVGHRCRGAKINGRIVQLNRQLDTGDQVEILTGAEDQPRRDWLNINLGFVTTSRARAKISHWFKLQAKEKNAEAGQQIVNKEFKRLAIDPDSLNWKKISKKVNYKNTEDMYAALGAGDIRLFQIINAAQQQLVSKQKNKEQLALELPQVAEAREDSSGVRIRGVGNLLTNMASCCKPVLGDPISGYITQGRGVSVHRDDCLNIIQLGEREPERIIDVDWGETDEKTYPVDIYIEAFDRAGLLRDIMLVMAAENINIIAANTQSDKRENLARLTLTVEISRLEMLGRIMDKINQLPNVMEVHRQRGGVNI